MNNECRFRRMFSSTSGEDEYGYIPSYLSSKMLLFLSYGRYTDFLTWGIGRTIELFFEIKGYESVEIDPLLLGSV